ncbi:MAG: hypothetical protein J3K34DRAFT_155279 [Monoraphidium minutum]|nr:MAG: hypothetical protein J3K34DRAFT_155279 [Monoraphidium minutum]
MRSGGRWKRPRRRQRPKRRRTGRSRGPGSSTRAPLTTPPSAPSPAPPCGTLRPRRASWRWQATRCCDSTSVAAAAVVAGRGGEVGRLPRPVEAASPGRQYLPGVYLAASTQLLDDPTIASPQRRQATQQQEAQQQEQERQRREQGHPRDQGQAVTAGGRLPEKQRRTQAVSSGGGARLAGSAPLMAARPWGGASPGGGKRASLAASQLPQQFAPDTGAQPPGSPGEQQPLAAAGESPQQHFQQHPQQQQAGAPLRGSLKSAAFDVYGQPSAAPPPLPPAHLQDAAPTEPNLPYLAREGAAMRAPNTSSAALVKHAGRARRQLGLAPGHVHFGAVAAGSVARRAVRLVNLGASPARVSVERPAPPLRLHYAPGPIAPGMAAVITLELAPEAPGDYVGEVAIRGELEVALLTVSAKVTPAPVLPGGGAAGGGAAEAGARSRGSSAGGGAGQEAEDGGAQS